MNCFHRCARDWPVWAEEFEQALLDIGFALVLFQILGKPTHIVTVARLGIYNSDSSGLVFTPRETNLTCPGSIISGDFEFGFYNCFYVLVLAGVGPQGLKLVPAGFSVAS